MYATPGHVCGGARVNDDVDVDGRPIPASQAALRKKPTAPVTLDIETVNQNNETKSFTLCTLSETTMQQMYALVAW